LGAEAARAGGLVEDEAEVSGLRALERAAHLVDRPFLAARVRVEELNRRAEGELVVVQLLGERLRGAAAPARDLPQRLDVVLGEADERLSLSEVRVVDAVQRGKGLHSKLLRPARGIDLGTDRPQAAGP